MRVSTACLALSFVFTFAAPRIVEACSCLPPPEAVESARRVDGVFEATPKKVETYKDDMGGDPKYAMEMVRVTFAVSKVHKGDPGKTVEISTAANGAACGRAFDIGTPYLVYARKSDDGSWRDNLCSRTNKLADAKDDLAAFQGADLTAEPKPDDREPGRHYPDGEPEPESEPEPEPEPEPATIDGQTLDPSKEDSPPAPTPSDRGCAIGPRGGGGLGFALGLLGIVAWSRRRA